MRSLSTRRGFTLVETLVVVGIITLLLGLVMPAIKMVRAESRNSGCLSNLRQNFTAWQAYQVANKGAMPICEFLPVVTPEGVSGGLPNLLANFMSIESPTWICPADFDTESTDTGTSYNYLPGLLRFSPQVQMEVLQVLMTLPANTIDRQRQRLRLETEGKLVAKLFENDTKRLFPILIDSEDRHPGTRVPRNAVYLDGSARAATVEANTAVD